MANRKLTAALGFVASAALAAGFASLSSRETPPATSVIPGDLTVEPNVGEVRQNKTLVNEYALVNGLDEPVDVEAISKSCSCADASVEPLHIEPGQPLSFFSLATAGSIPRRL